MSNLILFDNELFHTQLLPLTFTRPISEIRCGIVKIRQKWENHFGKASWLTVPALQELFPSHYESDNLYVNASLLPDTELIELINKLELNEALFGNGTLLAAKAGWVTLQDLPSFSFKKQTEVTAYTLVTRPWHIFQQNGTEIKKDFNHLLLKEKSYGVQDPHTIVYSTENIFVGKGSKIKAAVLNAEGGPIYIGENCEVQEGSVIRGPFALCEGSTVNMGGKMKGDTTIGPFCKVGGEISNSVIFGYSNKGHDGFLGNAVLGEWCNLGADTNTSNLKNNYSEVSIWSYAEKGMVNTKSQFCGLTMGDHSKAGINTMFNTGTVVGVSANIFDGGFPPKHVPSFAWGGNTAERYDFEKAIETASRVMERRGKTISESEVKVLKGIFNSL